MSGNTSPAGCLGHSLCDSGSHSFVKGGGDDVVGLQLIVGYQACQCVGGSDLHFLVNVGSADIEGVPENTREGQRVVDMVGTVGVSGRNNLRAACFDLIL